MTNDEVAAVLFNLRATFQRTLICGGGGENTLVDALDAAVAALKQPTLSVGTFDLSSREPGYIWVKINQGPWKDEGINVEASRLEALLQRFYEENF